MELREHVEMTLRQRGLLRRDQRILVAVSGGLDSMVLLHLLHQLAQGQGWRLAVAHLNHRLRGRSSEADQRLVLRSAGRLGLPVYVGRVEVREFAREQKLSLEMAARRLRHSFLAICAQRAKATFVALAHHADDQVELFFVRLLRGAGGEGISGMKWRSPSPVNPKLELVRPLLDLPRQALQQYAVEQKLCFREDASNASLDILRNRIRHELLPLLKRNYQPGLDRTVTRLMDIIGAESSFVSDAARVWRSGKPSQSGSSFKRLPTAIQRAVIRQQLLERAILPDFEKVERLLEAADRRVSVATDRCVWRDMHGRVHAAEAEPSRFKTGSQVIELKGRAGECDFAAHQFAWRLERKRGATLPARAENCEVFDADAVGSPIVLRRWRAGDRFQPIGMSQPAKLQNLLTNARIPREARYRLVVAEAADGRLFWVQGLRIGEPFKLTARTNRRLHWRRQRL